MRVQVWESFVSWLDHQGLLTSKVQSRGPYTEHSESAHTSLGEESHANPSII
jgi:hypothetical protein